MGLLDGLFGSRKRSTTSTSDVNAQTLERTRQSNQLTQSQLTNALQQLLSSQYGTSANTQSESTLSRALSDLLQQQSTQTNPFAAQSGLFGAGFADGTGQITLSPALQALQQELLVKAASTYGYNPADLLQRSQQLRSQFLDQASGSAADAAQERFNILAPVLQDEANKAYLNLEDRLYNQGRLGSTGTLSGQADLEAFQKAREQASRQLLYDAYGQAANDQQRSLQLAAQAGSMYPQEVALYQSLAGQYLQPAIGLDTNALQLAQIFGGFAGQQGTTSQQTTQEQQLQSLLDALTQTSQQTSSTQTSTQNTLSQALERMFGSSFKEAQQHATAKHTKEIPSLFENLTGGFLSGLGSSLGKGL